jgi:hypothetical protein
MMLLGFSHCGRQNLPDDRGSRCGSQRGDKLILMQTYSLIMFRHGDGVDGIEPLSFGCSFEFLRFAEHVHVDTPWTSTGLLFISAAWSGAVRRWRRCTCILVHESVTPALCTLSKQRLVSLQCRQTGEIPCVLTDLHTCPTIPIRDTSNITCLTRHLLHRN